MEPMGPMGTLEGMKKGRKFPNKHANTIVNTSKVKVPGILKRIHRIHRMHRILRKRSQARLFGTWVHPAPGIRIT